MTREKQKPDVRSVCVTIEYVYLTNQPWHLLVVVGGESVEDCWCGSRESALDEALCALAEVGVEAL